MERTYKITIRTEQDVRGLFPSERRYSASTVLGISIVFIALTVTSILMGILIINKSHFINSFNETESTTTNQYSNGYNLDHENYTDRYKELEKRISQDLDELPQTQTSDKIPKIYTTLAASAFLMSLGTLTAAITGLLAWKIWYIDHYIFVFFLSCVFSSTASLVSFVLMCFILFSTGYTAEYESLGSYHLEVFSRGIAVNTIICIVISLIWSTVASNIAYKGVISPYPDDQNFSKRGNNIQVITEVKGNKDAKMVPPDVLNHFPISEKMAKFFPKKENKSLPKSESNHEYNDRVNKFLTDLSEITQAHKSNNQ